MNERRLRRRSLGVKLDYTFDRLSALKLEEVYDLLVRTQQRRIGVGMQEDVDEVSGDLRTGIIGSAERGTHDRESDRGIDRVRKKK